MPADGWLTPCGERCLRAGPSRVPRGSSTPSPFIHTAKLRTGQDVLVSERRSDRSAAVQLLKVPARRDCGLRHKERGNWSGVWAPTGSWTYTAVDFTKALQTMRFFRSVARARSAGAGLLKPRGIYLSSDLAAGSDLVLPLITPLLGGKREVSDAEDAWPGEVRYFQEADRVRRVQAVTTGRIR